MPSVNDLYEGIIAPQGGIYKPGADVVFPSSVGSTPSGVLRVTPEGLNVRGVKSISINPDGTPILSAPDKAAAITRALVATQGRIGAGGTVGGGPTAGNASFSNERLAPSHGIVSAYGEMNPQVSPAQQAIVSALLNTAKTAPPPRAGASWFGGWGSGAIRHQLAGDPAVSDWGAGTNGLPARAAPMALAPVDTLHATLLASQGRPVEIASGRTVPIGTTGSAQGGALTYQVQPDGSIVNNQGRVTAPAPGAPQSTAQWANAFRDKPAGSPFW